MKTVDYYLAPNSPYTYLGHDRLRALCAQHGAAIRPRVIDLGKVFPVSGGVALKDRAPQRKAYRLVELRRWSEFLGVAMNIEPKYFPVPAQAAAAAILAVEAAHGADQALDVTGDILRALWAEQRDIADEATLADLLRRRGFDASALLARAKSAETAARYEADTQEAIKRGVFGVPSYVLDGELFWGQDRLDFLARRLAA
jgi:2-hydroxychromene-2-carboxylate isomerase